MLVEIVPCQDGVEDTVAIVAEIFEPQLAVDRARLDGAIVRDEMDEMIAL
jgi:hypothetical protein